MRKSGGAEQRKCRFPTLLCTLNKYFQDEEAEPSYQQPGKNVTPKLLIEAIRTLPEEKKESYHAVLFLGHDRRGIWTVIQYVAQYDIVQADKLFYNIEEIFGGTR